MHIDDSFIPLKIQKQIEDSIFKDVRNLRIKK